MKKNHVGFTVFWVILGCVLTTLAIVSIAYAANAYHLIWILVPLYAILIGFGISVARMQLGYKRRRR